MARDTYYFSHDCNARNDRKLVKVMMDMGVAGIGSYWCIVEMLYENDGELPISDIPVIAKQLRIQAKTVEKLIDNYDLFYRDGEKFTSKSVKFRLNFQKEKSDAARIGALARWKKDANAMQSQCDGNAKKESKVKESKVPPTPNQSPCNPPPGDVVKKEVELPDGVDPKVWGAFIEMRKRAKAPPTEYALKLIIKDLLTFKAKGDDPNAVLNQSIMNNWKGVFALKRNGNTPAPQGRVQVYKDVN